MQYEIDVVTVTDGTLVIVNDGDIILGMKSDASSFVILRKTFNR